MGERGYIHSNIPDTQGYAVVDTSSGKEIGRIAGVFDELFVLAKQSWRVIGVEGNVINVSRFAGRAEAPMFRRHRNVGAFQYLLPSEVG